MTSSVSYCARIVNQNKWPTLLHGRADVTTQYIVLIDFVVLAQSMGYTSGAGTAHCSGPHEFTPGFKWGSCYSIFSFMFCRSLDVLFFWPLCCLFFFDIRILITPVVSSKSSYQVLDKNDFKIIIPYIFCLLYKSNKTI
jgi:hypothetical protein